MMASKGSNEEDDIPLRNVRYVYEEDEYGYVNTSEKRISKAIISQLPSRQFDLIDLGSNVDELSNKSLRRRQSQYRTLQLKTATLTSQEVSPDVDKIYEILNLDPDVKEEDKIKTLREMHQSLTIKRQVKMKLDADMERRRANQALDKFTRMKLHTHSMWHKFVYYMKNLKYMLEPWHASIKSVQGQFGSCVASYFIFLRWLLYLNLCNFFVFLFFLFIPQLAYEYSSNFKKQNNTRYEDFSGFDLLTGSGWFSHSALYFGHYSSDVIELAAGLRYNMPLAYLMTVGANSVINLVAVSFSLTSSYQKNYVDSAGDVKHLFCNKVFSAWDYSIETEDAAKLRKVAFCNEIKELLSFMRKEQKKKTMSEKLLQGFLMVVINICCLGIAIAISYGVYYLLEKKALKVDVRILEDMTLSLTVTLVSSSCYFVLKYATRLEYYFNKKTRLYLTMIRVVVLRSTMIGIIVYFWMIAVGPAVGPEQKCDATELGKEIYRLILVNFFVFLIFFTFFGEFIRKIFSVYVLNTVKLSEFDVAFNTLELIYYQTLAWIGTFCMPLAPLILIILLFILFQIKMNSLSLNCRPPKRTWSVNEAQTFFLTLLFLIYLLSAFTVGYVIFALPPSKYCGPFQGYESTAELIHDVFFHKGKEHKANELVKYFSSPGVLFAFFCALCVVVYYTRAQSKAHVAVVKLIREQLIMEGKDKTFLLKLFDEALASRSQMNVSDKNDKKKDPPTPLRDPSEDTNQDVLFNKTYQEELIDMSKPPPPRNLGAGYMPANVPVNKTPIGSDQGHTPHRGELKFRSPLNSSGDSDTPSRRAKGIHIPSHQPGFRHILGENSPRASSEEFRIYP